MINKAVKNYIKNHAVEENPNECCGLIYFDEKDELVKAQKVRNLASDKKISFSIDPVGYYKVSTLGSVKAIYHSHSNGNTDFSIKDKEDSIKHKINFVLYDLYSNTFKFFDYKKNKEEILEADFQWGKSDCISLVQRYIQKEKGYHLILPEELDSRDSKWVNKNLNIVSKTFDLNKHAWTQVDFSSAEDLCNCDILCFSLKSNIDHFGIYTSNGMFLHHPIGKKPKSDKIEKYYNNLTKVYRFKL